MITFENVTKVFQTKDREVAAVKDVCLTVKEGEIFGIIGFSGAGKSTLLRLVNLLEKPTSGKIFVNRQEITKLSTKELRKLRQNIGMIFQNFNLFNSRTVFGNVEYPLKIAQVPKEERKRIVWELLRFVGLEDKAGDYPEQLSGGQKQRVGIARALATSPKILICDEPTSALDPETTNDILNLLKKVNRELNVTILLITHEMHVIRKICDRVAVMEEGRIIEEGSVLDIFTSPKTRTTKNFIRSVIHDSLSESLLEELKRNGTNHLYRLTFKGDATKQPILSRISKRYNVDVNILNGNISELQGQLFGNLIVEIIGDGQEVKRVIEELKKVVQVKEVLSDAG
ncbi:methionine ABC transporter ATP-binding protein [Caldibacillus debilis]|jgi:D-methionine transport system ATP-binding protein|uniref:ABC-type metal ion transport system, ATPase component n=1 Tax=Caldibacillus debilis GB1 TaxID=1339248 RepID=A0A420VJB4_9BACI|nr:methionine ABC transporter ATP-binding protein [Caldibacillus debilis]RKO63687.1 ABC-type metal ion transport system, ATPase component [Caldibacillus debilis GB1]